MAGRFGPNVLVSLVLLVLDLCAWFVLVSTTHRPCAQSRSLCSCLVTCLLSDRPLTGRLLQLGGAASLQKNGTTIAPLLNQNSAILGYGDLTPQTVPRRFISYEWFKYANPFLLLEPAVSVHCSRPRAGPVTSSYSSRALFLAGLSFRLWCFFLLWAPLLLASSTVSASPFAACWQSPLSSSAMLPRLSTTVRLKHLLCFVSACHLFD